MAMHPRDRQAIRGGVREAQKAIRARDAVIASREAHSRSGQAVLASQEHRSAPADKIAALGPPPPNGILIAEGDSWFDYPGADVLSLLESRFGFDIESVASAGDRIEDMAYSGDHLTRLTKRIERIVQRGDIPRAILLSGGGNDIAGDDFAMFLNHAGSPQSGLNNGVVTGVIDHRLRDAYLRMLAAVTAICEQRTGQRIRILIHGYDYAVPDGRGVLGGAWVLPGPWLAPGFARKGYRSMPRRRAIVVELINRFNEMLSSLASLPEMNHVTYLDLRHTLATDATYRRWWANEMHPTRDGFLLVAQRFAAAV